MIQTDTFEKYMPIEMKDREGILKEGFESETMRLVLKNFEHFLQLINVEKDNANVLLENIAVHLVLFERLARKEEEDKKITNFKTLKMMERNMNLENFKYSLQFLSEQYTKNPQEKTLINKIIKRIKPSAVSKERQQT